MASATSQSAEFDDDDDEFFATLELPELAIQPPPPKKRRMTQAPPPPAPQQRNEKQGTRSTAMNQMPDQEDDSFMVEMADALEAEGPESKGYEFVERENRFQTAVGRPHPLLIPDVVNKIVSYSTTRDLAAMRLTTKVWNPSATAKFNKLTQFRNLRHIMDKPPYGLGMRTGSPYITSIVIADTCTTLQSNDAWSLMEHQGPTLTQLTLDANLWCDVHIMLLGRLLKLWTPNLESLKLVGVANRTVLENYSILTPTPLKVSSLRSLTVTTTERSDHHHFSTVTTVPVDPFFRLSTLFTRRFDGGMIGRIMNVASLEELSVQSVFRTPCGFLRTQVRSPSAASLRTLKVFGGRQLTSRDIRYIDQCHLNLTSLHLGPLSPRLNTHHLEQLLTTQAATLKSLTLDSNLVERYPQDRTAFLQLFIPVLEGLEELKITNIFRLRVGTLDLTSRLPALKRLFISNELISQTNAGFFKTSLEYLETMFSNPPQPGSQENASNIEEVSFTGAYPYTRGIAELPTWFSNLKSVTVFLPNETQVAECLAAFSNLPLLRRLSLVFLIKSLKEMDLAFAENLPKLNSLTHLTLESRQTSSSVHLTPSFASAPSLFSLNLINFYFHDTEAESLATHLTSRVNMTSFHNCKIYKKPRSQQTKLLSLDLNAISITRLNLTMMIRSHFHQFK